MPACICAGPRVIYTYNIQMKTSVMCPVRCASQSDDAGRRGFWTVLYVNVNVNVNNLLYGPEAGTMLCNGCAAKLEFLPDFPGVQTCV